jgi:hypothetical protein
MVRRAALFAVFAAVLLAVLPSHAAAHCDALDGPVVNAARAALERKDVTPVLKWIGPADEVALRDAFAQTLAVRALSPAAREVADRWFFETVVRLHRAKEGEPFTGLKPVGTDPGPAVRAADRSIEQGSADGVVRLLSEEAASGAKRRLTRLLELKRHAGDDVAAGRAYTAAYAEYVHYVEALHGAAARDAGTAPPAGHDH